jgi:hypothetical protein
VIISPLIYEASSLKRKLTTDAISEVSPALPKGIKLLIELTKCGFNL